MAQDYLFLHKTQNFLNDSILQNHFPFVGQNKKESIPGKE